MKWLNRLRCELQDHIRVTEDGETYREYARLTGKRDVLVAMGIDPDDLERPLPPVTRCTRCGWTSRRMDG